MSRNNINRKETIITIFVLLGGVAFTVMSFCVYYLIQPLNIWALVAICIVDFIYNFFSTCLLFKYVEKTNKWTLKGFLLSLGYIVGFIIVAVLFLTIIGVISGSLEFLKNNILGIILYAFFTGPSIFVVLAIFLLCLAYG